jgi:hypothetical protein
MSQSENKRICYIILAFAEGDSKNDELFFRISSLKKSTAKQLVTILSYVSIDSSHIFLRDGLMKFSEQSFESWIKVVDRNIVDAINAVRHSGIDEDPICLINSLYGYIKSTYGDCDFEKIWPIKYAVEPKLIWLNAAAQTFDPIGDTALDRVNIEKIRIGNSPDSSDINEWATYVTDKELNSLVMQRSDAITIYNAIMAAGTLDPTLVRIAMANNTISSPLMGGAL